MDAQPSHPLLGKPSLLRTTTVDMTGLKPYRKGLYRGLVPDTDPIYNGSWQISPGRGSNPSSEKKPPAPKPGQEASKPERPPITGIPGKAADDSEDAG
jgi:hypothetical protein